MSVENHNEENAELQERIGSVKNISYYIYTNFSRTTMICTAIAACVMTAAIAFLGEWYNGKLIEMGACLGAAVIIISIIALYNHANKQYLIECENGKNILIVGGFRRFRKYCVNRAWYAIKKGQAYKITAKRRDSVKLLFSEMKKSEIVKKVSGNKEIFSVKQKNKEDFISTALGGGSPVKYGEMTFVDGKFKKGCYTSTGKMNYTLYFRVVQDDVKSAEILPQGILALFDKAVKK